MDEQVKEQLAEYQALANEVVKRVLAERPPTEIRRYIEVMLRRLGGAESDEEAVEYWPESLAAAEAEFLERQAERQAGICARELSWPWPSWNACIDPLEPGLLVVVAAPDGAGKTIYAESLAEHWAKQGYQVAFCHYELNRRIMHERRLSRYASLTRRQLREPETLTPEQVERVLAVRPQLSAWEGWVNLVRTPGWTMERTLATLDLMVERGRCDVAIIDYLEKVQPSEKQLAMWGRSELGWTKDNVEQVKDWAETRGVPVVLVNQFNKAGKNVDPSELDRTAIRDAGEKTERANVVVLLHRERTADGYSDTVNVIVDKNSLGPTKAWRQKMRPEFFRVADIAAK